MLAVNNRYKEKEVDGTLRKEAAICGMLSKETDNENTPNSIKLQKLNKNEDCDKTIQDLDEHLPLLIQNLRTLLKDEDLGLIRTDDEFLTMFIRVREYKVDRALTSVKNCYRNIRKNHDMLNGKHSSQFLPVYEDRITMKLKHKCASDGSTIGFARAIAWDPNKHTLQDVQLSSLFLVVKELEQSKAMQLYGFSIIFDLQNVSFAQLKTLTPKEVKLLVTLAQDGFPVKITGVHFINYPSIFAGVYYIAQRFMKEKLRKRVHFHPNLESLNSYFGVDSLPTCIGGSLELEDAIDLELVKEMSNNDRRIEEYFAPKI